MIIEKEHFEAWLFSQPDERTFQYWDGCNCLVASFLKETTNLTNPAVCQGAFYEYCGGQYHVFPTWLRELLPFISPIVAWSNPFYSFTAGEKKSLWNALFKETCQKKQHDNNSPTYSLASAVDWGSTSP